MYRFQRFQMRICSEVKVCVENGCSSPSRKTSSGKRMDPDYGNPRLGAVSVNRKLETLDFMVPRLNPNYFTFTFPKLSYGFIIR